MFAKTIIDSDAFLDMSLSTQALYFHLAMRADDDGFINNPKKIMRMIGSSDDEMKILIAKQYIIPFDSGIVVIRHWRIHNYIQKDRYHPSACEEKALLVSARGKAYEILDTTVDTNMDTSCTQGCIQDGNIGKVRLGKVRLDKDIDSENSEGVSTHTPYQKIVALYHEKCPSLPKVQKITDSRKKAIKARWNEYGQSVDTFKECFERVEASDFLSGRNGKWSNCGFDWIMKESNFTKIMEGNYGNKNHKLDSPSNGIVDTDIDWSKYDG
jgi:hypothetical protein